MRTTTIMPPGVLQDFGLEGSIVRSATSPIPATFRVDDLGNSTSTSYFEFLLDEPFTEQMREALQAVELEEQETTTLGEWFTGLPPGEEDRVVIVRQWVFENAAVYWRGAGSGNDWSIMADLFYPTLVDAESGAEREPDSVNAPALPPLLVELDGTEENATKIRVPAIPATDTTTNGFYGFKNAGKPFPEEDQAVEVMIVYDGVPTKVYPLHISGITTGELLRRLYAGEYSDPDPVTGETVPTPVRYDPAALSQMTDPVLARITEPVDDLRAWAEKHVYAPTGWFPALDFDGRISPLSQVPPPTTAGLDIIDDDASQPSPDWDAGESVVNVLRFTYPRFYVSAIDEAGADGISVRDVTIEYRDESSIDRYGESVVEYEALVSGATGNESGEAEKSGDFEPGRALAADRRLYVFDRFQHGAQALRVPVRRAMIPDLRAGHWAVVDLSWIPDYVTRRRGAQFVGQVVAIADLNCAWRGVTIEEALPIGES